MQTMESQEYTWDYRNRLTKVVFRNSSGGAIVKQVDYEYDPYNRLVHRTFDADGAGSGAATDQFWVYDEGINAVMQFDGSSGSNLSHRYLWSDNIDELLADEQIAGNNTLWGLADHLGSLRDIADYSESTGVTTIANHRTINSFGKLVSETNAAVDMLFAFTGKQFDEATGLQHNLFRWLDPTLGQWLNEDPIGFAAGDENVRRYVGNGVVYAVDPSGLEDTVPEGTPSNGYRGIGSWQFKTLAELKKYLDATSAVQDNYSHQRHSVRSDWSQYASLGCVGLAMMRLNFTQNGIPGSLFLDTQNTYFGGFDIANSELQKYSTSNPDKAYMLYAVQFYIRNDPNAIKRANEFLESYRESEISRQQLNQLSPDSKRFADFNYATWHPYGSSGYWEYMNHGFEGVFPDPPTVHHERSLPESYDITIYVVREVP